MIEQENVFFKASDNIRLYRRTWGTASKGVIIFLHGFASHTGRYRFLIRYLSEHGYSIESFDLRGHGQSDGLRGHVEFFSQYLEDLELFLQIVKEKYPNQPLFLLGHDQGGHIILRYCIEYPQTDIQGVVVSSPLLSFFRKPPLTQRIISRLAHQMIPTLQINNLVDVDFLSHDIALVEETKKDSLYLKMATIRWYRQNKMMMNDTIQQAQKFHFPLLIQQAEEDHIANKWMSVHFYEQLRSRDKQYLEYSGYFHEIYNETPDRREPVFNALGTWLDDHLPQK